ncbi:BTB/POZ domain-containing protein 2-like isoform X2 [Sitodiplosis mosellana]|nr:BTB/POZ domain-containing protein 2-like isoform X2 [Sitodiplosis mosellana]
MADFYFIFETTDSDSEYERVAAHKLLLATGSDVFRAMFNGSWKEQYETKITDASADEFKQFLQFFYINTVEITMDSIAKVMYLGDKYNVPNCLSVCEKFVIDLITDDNVSWAYEIGIAINQDKLKKYCETIIGLNTKAVLTSDSFLVCTQNTLGRILSMKHLSCTEAELFESCMRWVKVSSGQDDLTKEIVQTELGSLFDELPFGSMSLDEFSALDPLYGNLFTFDEYREVIRMIASKELKPTKFNGNHQKRYDEMIPSFEGDSVQFNRLISKYGSSKPYYIQNIETTTFSTNEPIFLVAFECSKVFTKYSNYEDGIDSTDKLSTDIKIVTLPGPTDSSKEIVLYEGTGVLEVGKRAKILLNKPILIRSGLIHEIRMNQSPPDSSYTSALLKTEVQVQSDVKIQFHGDPFDGDTDVARGLILGFEFHRI